MAVFAPKFPDQHFRLLTELAKYDSTRLEQVPSVNDAVEQIIQRRLPQKLVIGEVALDGPVREAPPDPGRPLSPTPDRMVTLLVPFQGDPELLRLVPQSRPMYTDLERVEIRDESAAGGQLQLRLTGQLTTQQIDDSSQNLLRLLNDAAAQINRQVDGFEANLRPQVNQWVRERLAAHDTVDSINAELTIPIFAAPDQE